MSSIKVDGQLLERLGEIASQASLVNTTELLSDDQRGTAYLFLAALACRSETEYNSVRERLGRGEPLGDDFNERLALVTRAFCVGHDWVLHNWCLWKK